MFVILMGVSTSKSVNNCGPFSIAFEGICLLSPYESLDWYICSTVMCRNSEPCLLLLFMELYLFNLRSHPNLRN